MKQYKVFVIANLIFGILLIALTKVILPVCRPMGGGVMRCGTSTTIVAILGLVLLVVAVAAAGLLKKKPGSSRKKSTSFYLWELLQLAFLLRWCQQ